jgi:hypothetical protein
MNAFVADFRCTLDEMVGIMNLTQNGIYFIAIKTNTKPPQVSVQLKLED